MKNGKILILLIGLVLGCKPEKETDTTIENRVITITTAKVQYSNFLNNLRYSGTIEALQTIPLTFQTSGIVEQVYVQAGDMVRKGQLLAKVDDSDLKNLYNITLSKYEQAKDAYERLKTVHDNGSLPEIKWVEMLTNLEQAKSSYEISKNNLDKCNLRAPEDGCIGKRNIEPGQSSIVSTFSAIDLVKIESVYIKISVPENEIGKIKKNAEASITVTALNDKTYEGLVTNISPVADAISRTYAVKITVNNPSLELKPGMICDASLKLDSKGEVLTVPYKAVSTDNDGKPFVFVVSTDKKRVKKQIITTGSYHESGIEVLSGLSLDEIIVVEGKEKLSDNSLIQM